MEDNFLGLLTLDDNLEELTVRKRTKQQLKDEGFSTTKSINTKNIADFLLKHLKYALKIPRERSTEKIRCFMKF